MMVLWVQIILVVNASWEIVKVIFAEGNIDDSNIVGDIFLVFFGAVDAVIVGDNYVKPSLETMLSQMVT